MNAKHLLGMILLGGALFVAGCGPAHRGSRYYGYGNPYGGYDSYSGRGIYDPYYSTRDPYYYGNYDNRSHREVHRDIERGANKVERKYDKAMDRLDRQEREAREKAGRKYGGNTSDPHYRERLDKIDRKYDHKRDKVEHLRNQGYRKLDRKHDDYHGGW
ncbi:MAG: hypothetical protein AB7G75_33035 [Candidatus Binatia bacterium]